MGFDMVLIGYPRPPKKHFANKTLRDPSDTGRARGGGAAHQPAMKRLASCARAENLLLAVKPRWGK